MKEPQTNNRREADESIVNIDPLQLDKECVRLPLDYLRYAQHAANLRKEVDRLKSELEVVWGDTAQMLRKDPSSFGLEKVTEAQIKETVVRQEGYQTAERLLRKAEHQLSLCQAVVGALDHKKRSLTLLVELHGMSYFSNVKLTEKGQRAVEEMTKQAVRPRRRVEDD